MGTFQPERMTRELDIFDRNGVVYGLFSRIDPRGPIPSTSMNSAAVITSSHEKCMKRWKTFQIATSCIFSTPNTHNLKHTGREGGIREWGHVRAGGVPSWGILRSSCASVSSTVWVLCQKTNRLLFHRSWFCWFFTKSCSGITGCNWLMSEAFSKSKEGDFCRNFGVYILYFRP